MTIKKFTFSTIFCLLTHFCFSQVAPIDTDRPDQTESVNLVPAHFLQFEAGIGIQQNETHNNEIAIPTLLIKYGISERFELRLNTTFSRHSFLIIPNGTISTNGFEPLELGTKIALWKGKMLLPTTAFLFHLGIPVLSSKNNRIQHAAPSFKLAFQNPVTKSFGVGYNVGAEWDGNDNEPSYIYTLSPGVNITQRCYGYIEVFGAFKKNEPQEHSIDGGFAYNITNNCKLDISSGVGITSAAPDWYIAVGISVRLNTLKK